VFALGLAASLLLLVLSPLLTIRTAGFLDPRTVDDAEPVPPGDGVGTYVALAGEELPAAETVVVEEFGHDVSMDGTALTWGASIRNAHNEYAVAFGLQVSVDGVPLYEGEYSSASSTMTPPGVEVRVGGSRYLTEELPSEPVVAIEVVRLEWFAVDGGAPPEPQVPPLSVRVDGIDEGDDPRGQVRFSVTVANSAAFAVDPWLTAVFRRADGTPVGGALVFQDLAVPPGESFREFQVWKQDVPAGAELSLTEFAPSW
jgi:hypothetical protein